MAEGWSADRHGAGVGSTSGTANPDQGSTEHRSAGYCPAIGAGFVNDGPPAHESSPAPYDSRVLPTSWSILPRMTVLQLTQAMIDEGIVRAEKVGCSLLDDRCFPLCWRPRESHEMCKPKRGLSDRLDRGQKSRRPVTRGLDGRQNRGQAHHARSSPTRGRDRYPLPILLAGEQPCACVL
jgi:hypothetical protein